MNNYYINIKKQKICWYGTIQVKTSNSIQNYNRHSPVHRVTRSWTQPHNWTKWTCRTCLKYYNEDWRALQTHSLSVEQLSKIHQTVEANSNALGFVVTRILWFKIQIQLFYMIWLTINSYHKMNLKWLSILWCMNELSNFV